MLARFLPQTVPFFELLTEQNDFLQKMAQNLLDVTESNSKVEESLKQINLLEEETDTLNRKITWHLSQTFITPIDREDIHALNLAQERVADGLQNLANRIFVCGFIYQRFPAQMMATNLEGMVRDTATMLKQLTHKKDLSAPLRTLKARKSDCEMLLATGLLELQDVEITSFAMVKEIILWGQIYERIERVVDLVSDLADTMEQVVLKYV